LDNIKLDLRQLDNLDIQQIKQGHAVTNVTPHHEASAIEKIGLKSSLDFGSVIDPNIGFLREPIRVSEHPPTVSILPPTKVLLGAVGSFVGTHPITIGLGPSAELFAVVGFTVNIGIYGSTTPELGLFDTVGIGLWTAVGFGVGGTLTVVLGPPSSFFGEFWSIGIDVAGPPPIKVGPGVGVQLLFAGSFPTFPPRFMGFAIRLRTHTER
jgi:hypothetical protein